MAYATTDDLAAMGLPEAALEGVALVDQQAALDSASAAIDSYLRARYSLPLVGWGDDLKKACCQLAAYALMVRRGYNPEAGRNDVLRRGHEDAEAWLLLVAKRVLHPDISDSATKTPVPMMFSRPLRGW